MSFGNKNTYRHPSSRVVAEILKNGNGLFEVTENTDFTAQDDEGDEPRLSPEMELHKARMDDFIFRHNMAMRMARERGESSGWNDVGEAASNHRGTD